MSAQVIHFMVARDGIEPSTRGFSGRATEFAHRPDRVQVFRLRMLPIPASLLSFGYLFARFLSVVRNTNRCHL